MEAKKFEELFSKRVITVTDVSYYAGDEEYFTLYFCAEGMSFKMEVSSVEEW